MVEHVDIPDGEIHEPKGITSAADGDVYVADGSNSGDWATPYLVGSEDDNHAGASQSIGVGFASRTYLLNDAAGSFTTSVNRLPTKSDVWDTINNEFDFGAAGYELGDQVEIRIDMNLTTTGANNEITTGIELALGSGGAYNILFDVRNIKSSSTLSNYTAFVKVDLGDTNTLNFPAKLFVYSDSSGDTVQVNGWRTFIQVRKAVYA